MRFRQLDQLDGPQREQTGQFLSSSLPYLIALLLTLHGSLFSQSVDTTSIFPLNTGDWTEYVAYNSTYFASFDPPVENEGWTTLVREVLGDTVMGNSFVYKVIRWKYMMHSIRTPQPWYQYLRKDAQNKIWGWGNNEDSLMYDFSQLQIGYSWQIGKSNIDGSYYSRTIASIWKDTLFGNVRNFYLVRMDYRQPAQTIIGFETFVEGYGVVESRGSFINSRDTTLVSIQIWGSIIGKRRDGNMLASIDNILEVFPLNVGDSWHYRSNSSGLTNCSRIVSITCDTIFSDGLHYKGTLEKVLWDYPPAGTNTATYYYQRIDTPGNVYSVCYNGKNWISQRDYRFSFALGDTFVASTGTNLVLPMDLLIRKYQSPTQSSPLANVLIFEIPNIAFCNEQIFSMGWGFFSIYGEGWSESLVGARVHGRT
jgi:hypothetical protein